jgi:hypothetical protein
LQVSSVHSGHLQLLFSGQFKDESFCRLQHTQQGESCFIPTNLTKSTNYPPMQAIIVSPFQRRMYASVRIAVIASPEPDSSVNSMMCRPASPLLLSLALGQAGFLVTFCNDLTSKNKRMNFRERRLGKGKLASDLSGKEKENEKIKTGPIINSFHDDNDPVRLYSLAFLVGW